MGLVYHVVLVEQVLRSSVTWMLILRVVDCNVQLTDVTEGPARSLSSKDITNAIQRLEKTNAADAQKRAMEAAKNNLESYIYSAKDQV